MLYMHKRVFIRDALRLNDWMSTGRNLKTNTKNEQVQYNKIEKLKRKQNEYKKQYGRIKMHESE